MRVRSSRCLLRLRLVVEEPRCRTTHLIKLLATKAGRIGFFDQPPSTISQHIFPATTRVATANHIAGIAVRVTPYLRARTAEVGRRVRLLVLHESAPRIVLHVAHIGVAR